MSVYERYDETSRHYDETRRAIGAEILLGCLSRHDKSLENLALLDAGCGTGAYADALTGKLGRIVGVDLSGGMLSRARARLSGPIDAGRVRLLRGAIDALPFADGAFDAVMINQVLHHLDDQPEAGFPALRRVVAGLARVLRPGGLLVVNHCSQEQLGESYWYAALIPRAVAAFRRRFAPLETLETILAEAGFTTHGRFAPLDALCQGTRYFDGRGPLDRSWRDGDSIWALVEADELAAAVRTIEDLAARGELEAYVARHDGRRPAIGQITFVSARLV